ncbi:MAG: RNA-binding protein [Candidatus Latescibacterota bacterium]|jgi:RNA recognition motif-containing protein
MNIYVGNLPKTAKDRDLSTLFEPFGKVVTAAVVRDKRSGESRGFGFVEMATRPEGEHAIAGLNETEWERAKLHVNEAREREAGRSGSPGRGEQRFGQQTQSGFRGGRDAGVRGGHTTSGRRGQRGA